MCEIDHICCHAPSQGSKPESGRALATSPCCHSSVWLLTFHVPAPLPSHSSLPPSSLCSGRASHLEQQAAGGDDIICTAAHCSIGSEQRHVSLPLTIPSLTPSISLSIFPPHQPESFLWVPSSDKLSVFEQAFNSSPHPCPHVGRWRKIAPRKKHGRHCCWRAICWSDSRPMLT